MPIQIDRSNRESWLNDLGNLYLAALQAENKPEEYQGAVNAYRAELQAFNGSHPEDPFAQASVEFEDMQNHAATILQMKEARQFALDHPEDLMAQEFARAALLETMKSVPGFHNPREGISGAGIGDRSPAHVEIVGTGPAAETEIVG